ncbi:MAG: hypothetical protein K2X35_10075 [Bryobacteraceae bacterium]|nr:hypothetical protein [Bryobacteraceae bacterium]
MKRYLWLALAVIAVLEAEPLPSPLKGEYACTLLGVTAGLPMPGMAPTTMVTASPAPIGNLVIDGAGKYRTTVGQNSGSYEFANNKVTFTGFLGAMRNRYEGRGSTLSFSFSTDGVQFSCALKTDRSFDPPSAQQGALNQGPQGGLQGGLLGKIYFANRGGVFSIDLAAGRQRALGLSSNFDIRPSGEVVYLTNRGEMMLTTTDGTGSRQVPVYGNKNYSPRFSPDGKQIAYWGSQKPQGLDAAMMGAFSNANLEPLVIDLQGRLIAALGTQYAQPAWTPDGRLVVSGAKATGGNAQNAAIGIFVSDNRLRSLRRIDDNFDAPNSPAVSPDGSLVAFANGPNIWVCRLDGTGLRKVYEGNTRYVRFPAWSPDSKAVAFVDNEIVRVASLDGKEVAVKSADGAVARSISEVLWLP